MNCKLVLNQEPVLHTEFGNAKIYNGYYDITSRKEGNMGKKLHRLIFEKNVCRIPEGYVIHHKDGNKTNNCIFNLQLMKDSDHKSLHNTGAKHLLGNKNTFNPILKIGKEKSTQCKQGFRYASYPCTSKGQKKFRSVKVDKVIDKVTNFILSEDNDKGYIGYSYNNVEHIIKKDS